MNNLTNSERAFEEAQKVIPGGVNSPVRAFKSVGGKPLFIASGKGPNITDIDGNRYLDFVCSWGPLILGHADPRVVSAIKNAAESGTSFGAPTEAETLLARQVIKMFPSIELLRLVSSGTEAAMSALRVARGFTGKNRVVKFEGCYHGHADPFLVAAGSGALTLGVPDSKGVTPGSAADTLIARYNDLDSVESLFGEYGREIAAIIVEPVAANMGVIPPANGFLQGLRDIATRFGAALIFDEVITGFRLAKGGAQEFYGVKPDLTVLGKIIGGGLPVGAFGGRRDIMECIAPIGPVYQAGTLSGNPLAVAAGLSTLSVIDNEPNFHKSLDEKASFLEQGFRNQAQRAGVIATINRVGSLMTIFFNNGNSVTDFKSAMQSNTLLYKEFFNTSLKNGIYFAPSQFEAAFVSAAHSFKDIETAISASRVAFEAVAKLL
jgi:glutamate-1-semialdehyde 2,1-aminomutase